MKFLGSIPEVCGGPWIAAGINRFCRFSKVIPTCWDLPHQNAAEGGTFVVILGKEKFSGSLITAQLGIQTNEGVSILNLLR
jgi:hypothetical protein